MSAVIESSSRRDDVGREVPNERQSFERGRLPVFDGGTYDEHVKMWRHIDASAQRHQWALAAVAASLVRSVGGSPGEKAGRQQTVIQRFCEDVGIDRQTFQRLSRTYRTFAETCNTGGTRFMSELSFKHFEVASRLAKDPAASVAEAYEKRWSANELQRQLEERPDPPPFELSAAMSKLQESISKEMASWPSEAQRLENLQELFEGVFDDLAGPEFARLTKRELHAIRWIKAEMENLPYTKRTFNEAEPGRGGSLEVVAGAAGAPIYQEIVGTVPSAGRRQVIKAINNLLDGKVTRIGVLVRDVARDIAEGKLTGLMKLPPDAGGDLRGTLFDGYFEVSGTLFEGHYEWRGTSFKEVPPPAPSGDVPRWVSDQVALDDDDAIGLREQEAMV